MSKTKKRIAILIIASMLAPIFVSLIPGIGALTAKEVSAAASNAKLTSTKLEVGVNSSPQFIGIDNYNSSAQYTYISQNDKIATVTEYGMVSGVKYGTTKIDVSEKFNGVTNKLGTVSVNVVEPYLDKTMEVGANSSSYVNINFSNRSATYSYKSSDTKVVKVDKYGTVTGIKYGTAKISVTQKLNGKSKSLGSVKVTVVTGSIYNKKMEVPVSEYPYDSIYITNRNQKATYKYSSDNTKVVKVDKDGNVIGVKLGSAKVKVTETYNKKTVNLGSVTINVVGASIYEDSTSYEVALNTTTNLTNMVSIRFMDSNAYYYAKSDNESIISVSESTEYDMTNCVLNALAVGTAKLTIYEKKDDSSTKIGTVTVTVKDYPIEELTVNESSMEMVDKVPSIAIDFDKENSWYNIKDYLNIKPYNTTTPITYQTKDESIIKVSNTGYITMVATGSTDVTVTCGKFSVTVHVIIKAIPATNLKFDDYYFDFDSAKNSPTTNCYVGDDYLSLKDYLIIDPYNTTDSITFTSSDEAVVKVDADGIVTALKKGTATVTAKCGSLSTSLIINVVEE